MNIAKPGFLLALFFLQMKSACLAGAEFLGVPFSYLTWRIIPFSNWLISLVIVSPRKHRVVGPLPNGRTSWLIDRG